LVIATGLRIIVGPLVLVAPEVFTAVIAGPVEAAAIKTAAITLRRVDPVDVWH
jgi:hypothetical protein